MAGEGGRLPLSWLGVGRRPVRATRSVRRWRAAAKWFIQARGGVAFGGGGVGGLPGGVERGELFNEGAVLVPAWRDRAVVEGESVREPLDPVGEFGEHLGGVLAV